MAESVRITTKTIRVMGPHHMAYPSTSEFDEANQLVVDEINWGQVEDALNDQLPEGFYCKLED